MGSRFMTLFVLALLVASPMALAQEDRGFFAKVMGFFTGDDDNESGDAINIGNQKEAQDTGTEDSAPGAGGTGGGYAPPGTVPDTGYACNPCSTVVCKRDIAQAQDVDGMPEYHGLFVCPGKLSDCNNIYGDSCEILPCSKPVGCTAKVHTCYDYSDAKPMPMGRSAAGSAGVQADAVAVSNDIAQEPDIDVTDEGCFFDGEMHEFGERFKVDCNTCSCDENGRIQCTEMACAPDPVCGNGICEAGEASYCPEYECNAPDGVDCPTVMPPCYEGTCDRDCTSVDEPIEPKEPIRCVGTLEECQKRYDVCSCGWEQSEPPTPRSR